MSGSRLSAVLRSSISPSAGDRTRLYSTTPSKNGFFKRLWSGDGDTKAAQMEVKTEEIKATETVAASNKSANSSAAPALRPSASAAAATPAVRTPSVAPLTSRRPIGASTSSAAPAKSAISGLQQRQQQQQWRPAIATRAAAAQQNTRFERPVGGSSRQTITPPSSSSSTASRGASPAFSGARSLPTPTSRAAAAAPLRVAVQRARIDARNVTRKTDATATASPASAAKSAVAVESPVIPQTAAAAATSAIDMGEAAANSSVAQAADVENAVVEESPSESVGEVVGEVVEEASFDAVVEKAEKEEEEVAKHGATVASREVDNEDETVETLISGQPSEDGGSFEEGEVTAQNFGVENQEALDSGSTKSEAEEVTDTIEDSGSQEKQNLSQNNDNADTGSIQDDSLETGSVKDGEATSVMRKIRFFFKR